MSNVTLEHPPRERLIDFGLGRLDDEVARGVESHVNDCERCCETLLNLQDDTFVNLVRRCDAAETQPHGVDMRRPVGETHVTRIEATLGTTEHSSCGEFGLPRELAEHSRYRIIELLGRGGMGDVYKAQHKVMDRLAALKVIKPALVRDAEAVRRFQREVQAAARLNHPNIVTAHDAEQAGDVHFLVMEFVDGVNLHEVVRRRGRLPVAEACEFIRQAAEGIEHAHQHGMVHRDIKPHNLMLAESGEVKILDFGLANFASEVAIEDRLETAYSNEADLIAAAPQLTQAGTMMGTPDYIAPEQAEDAHAADVRADIYSLGCTFYTLLTGRTPFGDGTVMEKIKAHTEREARPLCDFRDDVPAEVEAVLRKMMAKDPETRFQSPAEVVEALRQIHDQNDATRASTHEGTQTARWSRKDRFAVATTVLTAGCGLLTWTGMTLPYVAVIWSIGVLIGWGLSTWATARRPPGRQSLTGRLCWGATVALAGVVLYIQTNNGTVRIEINDPRIKVEVDGETVTFNNDGFKQITVKPGEHSLLVQRGDFKFETSKFTLGRGKNPSLIVERTPRQIVVRHGERELVRRPFPSTKPPLTRKPRRPAALREIRRYEGHTEAVSSLVVSNDGHLLVSGSADGTARVWDVKTRRVLQTYKGHRTERQLHVALSPDDQSVVTGDWNGLLRIWDRSVNLRTLKAIAHTDGVYHVAFSRDGTKILSVGCDGTAKVWDPKAGRPIAILKGHTGSVSGGAFFPGGGKVVTTGFDTTIRIWDVSKQTETLRLPTQQTIPLCVCVSPDGKTVAAGFRDGSVRLFDANKGVEVHRLKGHSDRIIDIAFTPDGRHLLSGSYDRTLRVWNTKTGKEIARATDKNHVFNALAVTPDGRRVFAGGGVWKPDKEVNKWTPEFDYAIRLWQLPKSVGPKDERDEKKLTIVHRFEGSHLKPVKSVAVSPDGRHLLSAAYDKTVRLWEIETGREIRPFLGHTEALASVVFSPDGKLALSGGSDGTLRLWDIETGKLVRLFEGHTGWIRTVCFSPDGKYILSGSADYSPEPEDRDRSLRLWDVNTGEQLLQFEGETRSINAAVFTPDGRSVLTASDWLPVQLWDVEKRKLLRRFATPESTPLSIAVSPDGRMAATGHNAKGHNAQGLPDGKFFDPEHCVVCLWDVQTGQLIRKLRGHSGPVHAVAFSPDGRYVLSGSGGHHYADTYAAAKDNSLRLWDVETGEVLFEVETGTCINSVAFTPDGRFVVSGGGEILLGGGDGKPDLRLWRLPESVWPKITEFRRFGDVHTRPIADVAHLPSKDGRSVAVAGYDGTVRIWNVDTARESRPRLDLGDASLKSIAAAPDGETIAVGDHSGNVYLSDVATGKVRRKLALGTGNVYDLAFSHDGTRLYVGMAHYPNKGSGAVLVYDAASGKRLRELEGADNYGQIVAPLPDGVHVVAGGQVRRGGVWNSRTGKLLTPFRDLPNTPLAAAASPDGTLAAIGFDVARIRDNRWDDPDAPGIWLCDVKTGRVVRKLRGHTGNVNALAFTADGRFLISGSGGHHKRQEFVPAWDNTLRVWNVKTGAEVARVPVETEWGVWSLALLPDGRHVVTAGGDKGRPDLRLWRLPKLVRPKIDDQIFEVW